MNFTPLLSKCPVVCILMHTARKHKVAILVMTVCAITLEPKFNKWNCVVIFCFLILTCLSSCCNSTLVAANVLGLCEEGDFKAQMFNKPQMLIEVQIFNLALLPLFRKAPVSGSLFFFIRHSTS